MKDIQFLILIRPHKTRYTREYITIDCKYVHLRHSWQYIAIITTLYSCSAPKIEKNAKEIRLFFLPWEEGPLRSCPPRLRSVPRSWNCLQLSTDTPCPWWFYVPGFWEFSFSRFHEHTTKIQFTWQLLWVYAWVFCITLKWSLAWHTGSVQCRNPNYNDRLGINVELE